MVKKKNGKMAPPPTDVSLRVVEATLRDVMGIRELIITPGKITEFSGPNASGKTSPLVAIHDTMAGSTLARIARIDVSGKEQTEPETVLVLDGAGNERYRVERNADGLRVRERVGDSAAFVDKKHPQEWLRSVFDAVAANPVKLLRAADKDRVLLVLEALAVDLSLDELRMAMGLSPSEMPAVPESANAFDQLAAVREAIFARRTGVNRDVKGRRSAADEIRLNSPAALPEAPTDKELAAREQEVVEVSGALGEKQREIEGELKARHDAARSAFDAAATQGERDLKAAVADLSAAHELDAAAIRAEAEERISAKAAKMAATAAKLRDRQAKATATAEAARRKAEAEATAVASSARDTLAAERDALEAKRRDLTALRNQAEHAVKGRALLEQAARFDVEGDALQAEADRLSQALEGLDAYRRRLLADIPVPGLEVVGREVRLDGIPWDRQNLERQTRAAVEIACLRSKRAAMIFVDDAEHLDSKHLALLKAEVVKRGVQCFVARVTDGEPKIGTEE